MFLTNSASSYTFWSLETVSFEYLISSPVLIALLLIAGVLFITISKDKKSEKVVSNLDYVTSLETRLEDALSKVDGAGKVKVVITVESGMETVLAYKIITKETSNGVEIEETPILVNGKTVTLMEKYPKVNGVLIVLEGTSLNVISRVQEATTSLLDIKLSQIEILTMK